jgi:glucokinase
MRLYGHGMEDVRNIVIAAAGAIDSKNGLVTLSPHIPAWHDLPLAAIVRGKFAADTYLLNDANAAAIGEHRHGAGRGLTDVIFLTVSSGIGGGIIINNEIYEGAGGGAGEIGHMTIDINGPKCPCGSTGCFEVMASGKAMAREAKRRIKAGEDSRLTQIVEEIENITAREIKEAAETGDVLAVKVINDIAFNLGVGLANVINIFNPEMIIIGGGLANFGEMLLSPARKTAKERAFPYMASIAKIVRGELGDDAGVVGAGTWGEGR